MDYPYINLDLLKEYADMQKIRNALAQKLGNNILV